MTDETAKQTRWCLNCGVTAYLETCSPEVIVGNLPTLVASLQRKRELIDAALARVKEGIE